jgi:hypothetical protein
MTFKKIYKIINLLQSFPLKTKTNLMIYSRYACTNTNNHLTNCADEKIISDQKIVKDL